MKSRLTKTTILATALMAAMAMHSAHAGDAQEAVIDDRSNTLTNTWGNCVRTKWQADDDVCAPAPPPPPPVVKAPPPPPPPPIIDRDARTIYFDFNSTKLTPNATTKLDTLVRIIKGSKRILSAGVVGYADEIGSNNYNIALSKKRSAMVQQYLDQRVNIPTQVLDVRGLGESNSVTDCKDVRSRKAKIECLAKDRRVEVQFKYQK